MDARFYNSEDIDIDRLASDLVSAYQSQGYRAQQIGNADQILVQIKKGGDFEAVLGMQAVLSVTIQRTAGGILAMIGQQRWMDKAAVGAVGIAVLPLLWPLAVTAGVGAVRQASLSNQALNMVDGLVRQQRPGINGGPIPAQFIPQVQRQWEPIPSAPTPYYLPPGPVVSSQPIQPSPVVNAQPLPQASSSFTSSAQTRCTQCNTHHEPGDTFCSGCGRPLAQRKVYCPNCNSELKPGLSFCSKCGTSTFQTLSAAQQTVQSPAPATTPAPPTPVYTPPTPPMPQPQVYYTPSQPAANDMPTVSTSNISQPQKYTPPPASFDPPPVYYVPSQPASNDIPTGSSSNVSQPSTSYYVPPAPQELPYVPPAPQEPPYVPPVTQNPPVQPKPKVTIVQSTPKHEPPPPKPRPQTQYYIPSNQTSASSSPAAQPEVEKQPSKPLVAQSVSRPLSYSNTPWGLLTFSDGQQVQLSNDRAVVGRYDHDLGGIPPEVDLSPMPGADTVSRIHASLEHIGNTYTLTDLNSTNATRVNNKRLEPDKATPISHGDTLQFGKVTCTFEKMS